MKHKQKELLERMKDTLRSYRDAEQNADAYYSAETIRNNMAQYFGGLSFGMQLMTGTEWHWGYDGQTYRIVELKAGKEKEYLI